jgi:hypothetical protein
MRRALGVEFLRLLEIPIAICSSQRAGHHENKNGIGIYIYIHTHTLEIYLFLIHTYSRCTVQTKFIFVAWN